MSLPPPREPAPRRARRGAARPTAPGARLAALVVDHPLVLGAGARGRAGRRGAAAGAGAGPRRPRRGAAGAGRSARSTRWSPRRADGDRAAGRAAAVRAARHHARGGRLRRRARPAALVVILCAALYAAAVDPDEVLRLFRRVSFRSALTATLATRNGARCWRATRAAWPTRSAAAPARPRRALAVVRAVPAGALDRAVDVAATLEVRGYGSARRPPARRRPWSRHDLAFAAAAVALVALAVGRPARRARRGHRLPAPARSRDRPAELVLAAAIVACALLPFADRRGIAR